MVPANDWQLERYQALLRLRARQLHFDPRLKRRFDSSDLVQETLLKAHGLVNVGGDPLLDLVAAQEQRMVEEGRERRTRRRYVVWGDTAR